jgi:hypothetical protein
LNLVRACFCSLLVGRGKGFPVNAPKQSLIGQKKEGLAEHSKTLKETVFLRFGMFPQTLSPSQQAG